MIFTHPIKKNNKFVSSTERPVKYFLSDVKIKSMHKFIDNKGYLISIYIPSNVNIDVTNSLVEFDNDTMDIISKQSTTWFNKSLCKEEVQELYKKSYCLQSHTIDVIVSYNHLTKYMLNNKTVPTLDSVVETIGNIKNLKQCVINCEIQHVGLYFYKENANHKWIIKSIDIMDTHSDAVYSHSHVKVDVEDKLQDNIKRLKENTDNKVLKLRETMDMLLASYSDIQTHFEKLQSSYGKVWEDQLKQINENIRNQEDKIKSI
jgi:hypothetical protein